MPLLENIALKPYTTFKVGGPARFFLEAKTLFEIEDGVLWAKKQGVALAVLGAGSNLLVSDQGFPGLVIHILTQGLEIKGERVEVEAGVMMPRLAMETVRAGLSGLEWGVGVPGTVGGAVFGNAGCFGGETKERLEEILLLDTERATSYKLPAAHSGFSYRDSIFKKHPGAIILKAVFKLRSGDKEELLRRIQEKAKERTVEQPIGEKTAGCVFKNPSPSSPAALLIEQAGLKGYKIGGAMVSRKHANFIINTGEATAEDIIMLISTIKERVHRKFDILLEEEIQYLGF